ncbi:protein THEMIS [Dugong dugon]
MALSLEEFVHSLDLRTLPRVLEIQSGIYFEGSIYEMFGNECCLSTGEVIKIIGLKIKKIIAEICEHIEGCQSSQPFELPMNFPGLFKIVADKTPYLTMEEITRTVHIGPSRLGHPCFYHQKDIKLGNFIIKQGEQIMLNSVEEISGEMMVNCGVIRNHQNHSFTLSFSQEGEFYECKDEHIYTLKEIVEWKIPKNRTRTVKLTDFSNKWDTTNPFPKGFYGSLILKPVYEIQGVMKFRKDIVRILPSLDVEVKDITDCYDANWFLQLLSSEDLFEMTSKEFPIVAEVIEGPQGKQLPRNVLQPGKTIVIHKKYQASRILASEIRSNFPKRHFLIPTSYKGKFKRRPREFPTAYDLEIAKSEKEPLHVVATKAFHPPYDELSSVSVGDQFLVHHSQTTEVLCQGTKKVVNVLACEKILKKSYEAALLPLYMEGGFVEVIHDKKQYQVSELCTQFHLPFNVKVSVRDLSIEEDILAATPGLRLEEDITDSYLLVSDFANPRECWEIPIGRWTMTVQLVSNLFRDTESFLVRTLVEEITEEQYYMMRRYESCFLHPPPRPPKHPSAVETKSTLLTQTEKRTMDLPKSPKSHRVDISKKPHSNQAGLDSKVPVGCQNDLANLGRERSKSGATAKADTSVTTEEVSDKSPNADLNYDSLVYRDSDLIIFISTEDKGRTNRLLEALIAFN